LDSIVYLKKKKTFYSESTNRQCFCNITNLIF